MTTRIRLNVIVAVCENQGIGKGGELPWRLRQEMKHFSRLTKETSMPEKKNMVVMGRKTWESIPAKFRPLPGRINVVLSSQAKTGDSGFSGSVVCESFQRAMEEAEKLKDELDTVWAIGGYSVYKAALASDLLHRLYITRVMKDYDCDTFFPSFDNNNFTMVQDSGVCSEVQEENGIQYKYKIYQKKQQ